tara:strand:+ start:582 stop:1103 length:522 start_codon:yes stop_codon:yes gene_type:complete
LEENQKKEKADYSKRKIKKMNLLKNEKTITLNCPGLILTNMRLRSEHKHWGKGQIKSVMLEDLCHSKLQYQSNPKLLIFAGITMALFAIIATFVGLEIDEDGGWAIAFAGAAISFIFIIRYFLSRRQIVSFPSSKNGVRMDINIKTKGLSYNEVKDVIDAVEAAKNERIGSLK